MIAPTDREMRPRRAPRLSACAIALLLGVAGCAAEPDPSPIDEESGQQPTDTSRSAGLPTLPPLEENAQDPSIAADCDSAARLISRQMDDLWERDNGVVDPVHFRIREDALIADWQALAEQSTGPLAELLAHLAQAVDGGENIDSIEEYGAARQAIGAVCTQNGTPMQVGTTHGA